MDGKQPKRNIQKPKRYKTTSSDSDDNPKQTINSSTIGTEIEDIRAEFRSYEFSKTQTSTLQDTMNTHNNVPDVQVQQSRDIQTQNKPNTHRLILLTFTQLPILVTFTYKI